MKNATDITVILDRSGSMSTIRRDMEGGFDNFINEQRKVGTDEVKVSLVKFDDKIEFGYQGVHLNNVPRLELHPRGGTALNDAVGQTINSIGNRLACTPESERPNKVIVLIITDGEENSSRTYSAYQVSEMVKHQTEKYNWTFVYLGSNQNAIETARGFGIAPAMAMTYANNLVGTSSAFSSLCSNITSYRGTKGGSLCAAQTMGFAPTQRSMQVDAGVDVSQSGLTQEELDKIEAAKIAKLAPTQTP